MLKGSVRSSNERAAQIALLGSLLASMRNRHKWDRIKCAIATGIPAFWILAIAIRTYLPTGLSVPVPPWLAAQFQLLLQDIPAIWTIAVSLAIAAFQWRNLARYQRHVIPLVKDMYERALTRRDPELLRMLGEALRFTSIRESFRKLIRSWFPTSR